MSRQSPVSEVMTTDVLTFGPDDNVAEAMQTLVERGIDGAPGLDRTSCPMSPDNINRGPGAKPPHCPRCAGQLARVHRRASDHWFASLRRLPLFPFPCRSVPCAWRARLVEGRRHHPGRDRELPRVGGRPHRSPDLAVQHDDAPQQVAAKLRRG